MEIIVTKISDVKILRPKRLMDARGFFSETYNRRVFKEVGIDLDFVQDSHSFSVEPGTIRGLHFQIPPCDQAKLVRVVRGKIFDVAVDIRRNSPTFGKFVTVTLSADAWNQILLPVGFAHGFCTLEPNTEVFYKMSHYYSREHERGIVWNDPDLNIDWPRVEGKALVSEKDRTLGWFAQLKELL